MLIRFASKAAFVLAIVAVAITQGRQEKQPRQLLSARGNEESNRMKPYFNDEEREILNHLRRILPAHSPATSTEIHGYFYAQYYSEANCSSGTGHVSYVEGYATGLCFQRSDETSDSPSGSVTQTCNPIDHSVTVETFNSLDCTGASTSAIFTSNICATTASKYGLSVDLKCSMDPSRLPLQSNAIVQSSFGSSNGLCDGPPQAFKAFVKSECQSGEFTDGSEYFTCPDQKSTYHLSKSFNGACASSSSSEFSNSSVLSNACVSARELKATIKPVGLYKTLEKDKTVCNIECDAFKDSCIAQRQGQPSHKPSAKSKTSHTRSPSKQSRVLSNKRPRKKTSQPTTTHRIADDDHTPTNEVEKTLSPTGQPSRNTRQPTSQPTTESPSYQPTSRPSVSTDDVASLPTFKPSKHLTKKPSNNPHRTTHHPSHRPTPHSTKSPISHAPIPSPITTCESLYNSCVARCPVVLPYTMFESFQQFSCYEEGPPSAAPSAAVVVTISPTIAPSTQSLSSLEIVQEISGISLDTARSVEFIFAFKTSSIASMKLTIPLNEMRINRVAANNVGRTLLSGNRVLISSAIVVQNSNVSLLSYNLNEAIRSGFFTEDLVNNGFPTATAEISALVIDTSTSSPSSMPSLPTVSYSWRSSLNMSNSAIIGITVGTFVFLCILSTGLILYCVRAKSTGYNGPEEVGVAYYANGGQFDDISNQKNDHVVDAFDHTRGIDQSGRGRL